MDSGKLKLPLLPAANSTGNFRPTQLHTVVSYSAPAKASGKVTPNYYSPQLGRLVFHERANRDTTDASLGLIYDKCSKPPGVDYDARRPGGTKRGKGLLVAPLADSAINMARQAYFIVD